MFPARSYVPGLVSFRTLFAGVFVLGAIGGISSQASANDGGISMGGTPRLLAGHPSVTMTSEVINIVVDKDKYTVDCRFVFTNTGSACTVRMGFPDEGYGADDPDEEEDPKTIQAKPPRTTFTSFRSYVDGAPTETKLVRGNEEGHYWHAKIVRFLAHGVRRIHDVYTQRVGGGIISFEGGKSGTAGQVAYILHTGSSWHGNIGRSEINVTFRYPTLAEEAQLMPLNKAAKAADPRDLRLKTLSPQTVVWKGPCPPHIQNNTLHFVRTNWRPEVKDDLKLTYNYRVMKSN